MKQTLSLLSLCSIMASSQLLSCRKVNSSSSLQHTLGDFVIADDAAFLRFKPTDSTFERLKTQKANDGQGKALANDHPATRRVQDIINKLDAIVRKAKPQEMAHVPIPRGVVIEKKGDTNGYVTFGVACVKQKVRQSDGEAGQQANPPAYNLAAFKHLNVGMIQDEGDAAADAHTKCETYEPKAIGWDVHAFVKIWNNRSETYQSECRLSVQDDVILIPSKKCAPSEQAKEKPFLGEADKIMFNSVPAAIFLFTGLTDTFSDIELTGVVAHELGHYYKAHTITLGGSFDPYFFIQEAQNELRRPLATHKHSELRETLSKDDGLTLEIDRVPGAKLDPNTFHFTSFLIDEFLKKYCAPEAQACHAKLKAVQSFESKHKTHVWFRMQMSQHQLSAEDAKLYLELEALLLSLFEAVPLGEAERKEIEAASLYLGHAYFKFPAIETFTKLKTWIDAGELIVAKDAEKIRQNLREAHLVGLGYYTFEEEADEVGLEIMARAGYEKKQYTDTWFKFWENREQFVRRDTSYADCIRMREAGWQPLPGEMLPRVNLGKIEDLHHGICYRVYNMEREWDAHQLSKLGETQVPDLNPKLPPVAAEVPKIPPPALPTKSPEPSQEPKEPLPIVKEEPIKGNPSQNK